MLSRLWIENFKAWREVDLTLGKVTGLFGTNSAGKSSLLQFLLLLKQTRNATDRGLVLDFGGPTDLVNLGTFKDVVHGHDENAKIRWGLKWTLPETLSIQNPDSSNQESDSLEHQSFEGDGLEVEYEVGWEKKRLWPSQLTYRFGGAGFNLKPKSKKNLS